MGSATAEKDVDPVSSKMHFEMWKEKQYTRLERYDYNEAVVCETKQTFIYRKDLTDDITSIVDKTAKKVCKNVV